MINTFFIQAGINRPTQPTIWTVKFGSLRTLTQHENTMKRNVARVNNPARLARLRDQAIKLRERVKRSTLAFLERSQARLAWWQRAFRFPMIADLEIFTKAKTLLSAWMALLGLASGKKSSIVALMVTGPVSQASRTRRRLRYEGLEQRQLLAVDISVIGNDLVIQDTTGTDNVLSLSRSGSDLVLSDANEQFVTGIAGAVLSNGNKTATIPASALGVGGKIIVQTLGGSDSLSVDVSTDLGFDVDYQGGGGTSDSLTLAADTATSVTHAFTNANDGSVTIVDGGSRVISYTGLEPIADNLIATDRVFTFNGGAETITLTDAAGANMTIDSTLSESVTFVNPTGSLTINAGTGNDIVTISSVDAAYNVDLTINGDAGSDTVNLDGDITYAGGESLIVNAESVTTAASADLTTSGAGVITFMADDVALNVTSTLFSGSAVTFKPQTASRPINLGTETAGSLSLTEAELNTITAGTVRIGDVNSGAITVSAAITHGNNLSLTTGAGITVAQALTMAADKSLDATSTSTTAGITLPNATSDIAATGTGAVSLTATQSIVLSSGSSVTTVDGNLQVLANQQVTPTTGSFRGVSVNDGLIQATGTGTVTVQGKGGTIGFAAGVYVDQGGEIIGGSSGLLTVKGLGGVHVVGTGAQITSSGGAVFVEGTGGGVSVDSEGVITSAGTGAGATVTVKGFGGNGSGGDNYGVLVRGSGQITSSGGAVSVEGTGGGSGASERNVGVGLGIFSIITSSGTGATVTVKGFGGNTTGSGGRNYGVNFIGYLSQITSSGGAVSVEGTGGGNGTSTDNYGVYVVSSIADLPCVITSAGTGAGATVTVKGFGGNKTGSGGNNFGVVVSRTGAEIKSSGGAVSVEGTGGGAGASTLNVGVNVELGGVITSAGTGATVTVKGFGGNTTGSGGSNNGVTVSGTGSVIRSSGGAVSVEGTGGGGATSSANQGVQVQDAAGIFGAGTGSVTLTGVGGSGSGGNNSGVRLRLTSGTTGGRIGSAGGAIQITGTAGQQGAIRSLDFTSDAGGSISGGPITLIADKVAFFTGTNPTVVNAGANPVTLRPQTNGTAINLGSTTDAAAGTLELSDAELDRITVAGTIIIGDSNSGTITVSGAITRAVSTVLNVTTGSGQNILFSGATTSINSLGGNVTLTTSGTGAISSGAATTDIIAGAGRVSLNAGSGGIGASANPLVVSGANLNATVSGNANQFLTATGSIAIDATGLNAGTGTVELVGGTFTLGGSGRINDSTLLNVNGATFAIGTFSERVDTLTLTSGSVTGSSGVLTSTNTIQTRTGSISAILAGTNGLTQSTGGTTTLSGNDSFSGTTTISGGTLALSGSFTNNIANSATIDVQTGTILNVTGLTSSRLVLASGQTLQGKGTVTGSTTAASGSIIGPGASPGILNTGAITFNSGSTFAVELNGTTVDTQYDQDNVTGAVIVNGGNLVVTLGFTPVIGNTFTIINNDLNDVVTVTSPFRVSGNPIAQGGTFIVGNTRFVLSYSGGTNANDVVLTVDNVVNAAPAISTNTLSVSEGATVVLGSSNINTTDSDNTPAQLTYTAGSVTGGRFELVAAPGVAITSFTQDQINSGAVQFVHNGGEAAPSYSLVVSDGALSSEASTVTIGTFTNVNDAPTAVMLTPSSASLAENSSTASATVLSTISVTDDGLGTNVLSLTGTDAASFELVGNSLRLKASVALDFETKSTYSVRVNVDDTTVGGTPDAFADFTLSITDIADAPVLTSVLVNGDDTFNLAAQRSQITSLVVTFSVPVVLGSNPFTIVNRDLPVLQQVPIPVTFAGSGTTYTIRFRAGPGVITRDTSTGIGRGNSLADGNFLLTIDRSKVTDLAAVQTLTPTNSFGDGDNEFGDRAVDNFFRLFGDSDGNGVVNSLDTGAFARAISAYNAAVDFDGNGSVTNSGVDRTNFLGNFNKRRRSF